MYAFLLVLLLLIAVSLIILIMLQQSRGTDMSRSFDNGFSTALLISNRSNHFIIRMTVILATLFFILNLVIGNMSSRDLQKGSIWNNLNQSQPQKNEESIHNIDIPISDIPQ